MFFGKKRHKRTQKLLIEIYNYIQHNHYNKFFGYNINRKYRLEVIIAELYYFSRIDCSYESFLGTINGKSLNNYTIYFAKHDIFNKVKNEILDKYLKSYKKDTKILCTDTCVITNKQCINDIDNEVLSTYNDVDQKMILKRHKLLKTIRYPKKRLSKTDNTKYNSVLKIGRNKMYKNKKTLKISAITNDSMVPLDVKVFNGARYDSILGTQQINKLNENINGKYLLADKGYDSKYMRESCTNKQMIPIIQIIKDNRRLSFIIYA